MLPVVHRLEAVYSDQIAFHSLNALDGGAGERAFMQAGLRGHPGYVIYNAQAQEVFRTLGLVETSVLEMVIQELLLSPQ